MSGYTKTPPAGTYSFQADTFRSDDLTPFGSDQTVQEDDFRTVAKMDLRQGEDVALGRGNSENPLQAQGFLYFDARSANDADGDGNKDKLSGRVRFVVLNASNTVVGYIWRGRLDQLRTGEADTNRRDRQPFPYQTIRSGAAEVYGDDYSIGMQIELDSGTDEFSLSASTLKADGYKGEKMN